MTSPTQAPEQGYMWTNARILAVELPIAREAAVAMLPESLSPSEPARATIFVADYPETSFGSNYREGGVLLHVIDASGEARHCPWMVVDDDVALIGGREMLGFPKKMAEIRLEESGDRVTGVVERKGSEVLRIEAALGAAVEDPAPFFAQRMVNVIGTPVQGLQLLELSPTSERFRSCRDADAKVTLGSSERDPLADMGAAPSGKGRYVVLDFGAAGTGEPPRLLGAVDEAWVARRLLLRAM